MQVTMTAQAFVGASDGLLRDRISIRAWTSGRVWALHCACFVCGAPQTAGLLGAPARSPPACSPVPFLDMFCVSVGIAPP
jgi:hypothetical protein